MRIRNSNSRKGCSCTAAMNKTNFQEIENALTAVLFRNAQDDSDSLKITETWSPAWNKLWNIFSFPVKKMLSTALQPQTNIMTGPSRQHNREGRGASRHCQHTGARPALGQPLVPTRPLLL